MLFKQKDQVQKLINQARADRKAYDELRREFETEIAPAWNADQTEVERLQALSIACGYTYRRGMSEELWGARGPALERQIEAAIAKRDVRTSTICPAIQMLRDRMFSRTSIVSGSFGSWVSRVVDKLPENSTLRLDLLSARKQAEELQDLGEIVVVIERWTDLVENREDVDCPLLKFDLVVARALKISEAAPEAIG